MSVRMTVLAIGVTAAGLGVWPASAEAQQRGERPRVECRLVEGVQICTVVRDRTDRRERERDRGRDDDRDDRERDARRRDRVEARRGEGPPFCRNGEGHPVFGMRWCRERGFDRSGIGLDRGGWEDIIFRTPRRGEMDRTLDRRDLEEILGDILLGRFTRYAGASGLRGPLTGRWQNRDVLWIDAGAAPVAELRDLDGDARIDRITLYGVD